MHVFVVGTVQYTLTHYIASSTLFHNEPDYIFVIFSDKCHNFSYNCPILSCLKSFLYK